MEATLANQTAENLIAIAVAFATAVSGKKRILITTHTASDGDAIASLVAAAEIVRALNSHPTCAIDGKVPERFHFLSNAKSIVEVSNLAVGIWDQVLIVDSGSISRIGEVQKIFPTETPLINIDHHADNSQFGTLNFVQSEASSTTEILYHLAISLDLIITPELATALYTGLLTDTGGFRYSNTTAESFRMAEHLVRCGVRPDQIANRVFLNNSLSSVRTLGNALNSLELISDNRIAIMTIPLAEPQEEIEDLADYALAVKGVLAAMVLRVGSKSCRVSLRGRGRINVGRIARLFGGGGHPKAAGFIHQGAIEKVLPLVIEELNQEIAEVGTSFSAA
ncbi:MAG: bifunctional oligoribonuclease/PAP phosphatase NrnA [bacterium]